MKAEGLANLVSAACALVFAAFVLDTWTQGGIRRALVGQLEPLAPPEPEPEILPTPGLIREAERALKGGEK